MKVIVTQDSPETKDKELRLFISLSSEVYTGMVDGEVACVWGLVPPSLLSESAHLWLWSNDLCDKHPFLLVRHSQMAMKHMLQQYPEIVGYCDVRQKRSRQWLTWLGATVGPPRGFLAPFVIRRQ